MDKKVMKFDWKKNSKNRKKNEKKIQKIMKIEGKFLKKKKFFFNRFRPSSNLDLQF